MVRSVHNDGSATLKRMLSAQDQQEPRERIEPPSDAQCLRAPLRLPGRGRTKVDEERLLHAAEAADAMAVLDVLPGDFIVGGVPVARVWPRGAELQIPLPDLAARIQAALVVGYERTAAQDVGFSFRQLTDVVVKALSPGINDPTTAVHALGHSAALLCECTDRNLGPRVLCDEDGQVRAVLRQATLADLLEVTITQPLHYGAADVVVMGRLYTLLREVAWCSKTFEARALIRDHLRRVSVAAERQGFDAVQQSALASLARGVEAALRGEWDDPRSAATDALR